MTGSIDTAAINCAENVALNHLLHEVPESPQHCPIEPSRVRKKGYLLPFTKERDLVDILSFLAKTKEGPEYIPAMCIEQAPNGRALKALLAINKRTFTDGNGLLQTLKTRFENVFDVLRRSLYERGSSTEITKQLLEMIIQMCSSRITSRLRLTGKKKRESKASIKEILVKAMEGTQQIDSHELRQSSLETSLLLFHEESKRVIQSVNEWSNHRVPARLNSIVEQVYRLNNVQGLQRLLQLIPFGPKKIINESDFANSLLNIIQKISRYKEAAMVLHRTAKKFPFVRNIEVQPVILPAEAFDSIDNPAYSPSLQAVLSRLGKVNGKKYTISEVSRLINKSKIESLGNKFRQKTSSILQEAKIHAEVQIIAHCEANAGPLFPRVIGSSKDVCFLCHALIQTHGKMHTSRTHGKLYPNWRLPKASSFKVLEHRFNDFLLNYARETIKAREKGQPTRLHPCPNESTLLPMLVSMSTISAIQHSIASTTEKPALVPEIRPELEITKSMLSNTFSTKRHGPSMISKLSHTHSLVSSDAYNGNISVLSSPTRFCADRLHIYVEAEESSASGYTPPFPKYSIEQITIDQETRLSNESLVVDVFGLQGEMTYPLPVDRTIHLTGNDTIVKIVFKQ